MTTGGERVNVGQAYNIVFEDMVKVRLSIFNCQVSCVNHNFSALRSIASSSELTSL